MFTYQIEIKFVTTYMGQVLLSALVNIRVNIDSLLTGLV